MSDIYNAVIWNLSKDEYEHYHDVAKRCGYHFNTVRKALVSLWKGNLVERKVEGRRHYYRNRQQKLDFELD